MELELYKQLNTLNVFLDKAFTKQKSHAYLLSGVDKDTLKAAALLFASKFVCKTQEGCLNCSSCQKVMSGSSIDIYTYPKKQNILVDDIKEIVETVNKKPLDFDKKIYILNDISSATIASQNKLLKTLEEPCANTIFILTAPSHGGVLPTIISRCTKLFLPKTPTSELSKVLSNKSLEADKLQIALQISQGSLAKTLEILKSPIYFEAYELLLDLLQNMKTSKDILKYATLLEKDKKNLDIYLKMLNLLFRDMLMISQGKEDFALCTLDLNKLKQAASTFSSMAILKVVELIFRAKKILKSNTNPTAVIDNLLVGILEEKHKWK